jgi:hypothetical protein
MNDPITQLGFLCIFNLIGGAAIGSALRGALRGKFSCNSIFFVIWGGLFGGLPLVFGFQEMQKGTSNFLAIQSVVFAGSILVVALIPEDLMATLRSPDIVSVAIGGAFLSLGVIMLFTNLFPVKNLPEKLLGGGIFGLIGGAVFLIGLWRILKS